MSRACICGGDVQQAVTVEIRRAHHKRIWGGKERGYRTEVSSACPWKHGNHMVPVVIDDQVDRSVAGEIGNQRIIARFAGRESRSAGKGPIAVTDQGEYTSLADRARPETPRDVPFGIAV